MTTLSVFLLFHPHRVFVCLSSAGSDVAVNSSVSREGRRWPTVSRESASADQQTTDLIIWDTVVRPIYACVRGGTT